MLRDLPDFYILAASSINSSQIEEATEKSIDFLQHIKNAVLGGGLVILQALLILIIGWWLIKIFCRFLKKWLEKSSLDNSAATFINSITKYGLRILLFIIVISKLGVDMTSIVAVFTSAALAIGLALQGSLSNIAGGLLILIMKPFRAGDYINDGNGHEGTVVSLEMIYTQLRTVDNKTIWIPNGTLANSSITNLTGQDKRRIDFKIGIDYDEDIDRVRMVLLETASQCSLIEHTPEPAVFVNEFEASSVQIVLRVECATANYWPAKYALQEAIKKAFDAHKIIIPYDHLDVNISNS